MTATIGPQLSALLIDLGIAHAEFPDPDLAESRAVPAVNPSTPLRVVLRVGAVDVNRLAAAGLHLPWVSPPVATGQVVATRVPAVADVPGVLSIDLATQQRPDLHDSVPATKADHLRTGPMNLTGAGIVVGVVDSGIDIYHHGFRNPDGSTRLLALMDTTTPYTITSSGGPTGGTFQLAWTPPLRTGSTAAQTTANLPFNATNAQVVSALNALAAIEPGDVLITGGPLPAPIVVFFAGRYLNEDVDPLTVAASAVTPAAAAIVIQRGRTYDRAEIDGFLSAPGRPFLSFDADGHGTHVMGIAAGNGSQSGGSASESPDCHGSGHYIGVAPNAELIAVKTTFLEADTMRGVDFVFTTAGARAAVVNLSLGGQSGAHDGSDNDEAHYDQLLTTTPAGRAIVISAGNDGAPYDHTKPAAEQPRFGGGLHALKTASPNATMDFVIVAGDRTDDVIQLWYGNPGRIDLQLTEPGGTSTGTVAVGDPVYTTPLAGHPLRIANRLNASTTNRHRISVRISPPAGGAIKAGTWQLTLTETTGVPTDVDAWIDLSRKDPHPRFSNADQDRTRTLTTPATAHNGITVASYDRRDNTLAKSSSWGPTIDARAAGETKPDLAAPGVGITSANSNARNNGICCDCCEDFYVSLSGTSMAAPHITGIVALLFQRNKNLTWEQARAHLRATADPPDPITGPTLPNSQWGAGIVNAETAAAAVPALVSADESPVLEPSGPVPGDPDLRRTAVPAQVPGIAALAEAATGGRLRELRAAVRATPTGELAAALVSTHFDEVRRLVNTERRVTVAWHRMHAAELLPVLLRSGSTVVVPAEVAGEPLAAPLARLLDALERTGSARLRADVARFRPMILALPGTVLGTGPTTSPGDDPLTAVG